MMVGQSVYPPYDTETFIFDPDPDDPDFNCVTNIDVRNSNGTSDIELHVRHSKSDPVLLSNMHSLYHQTDLDNRNNQRATPSPGLYHDVPHSWDRDHYHSLEELSNQAYHDNSMLTIEGLRNDYNSCFSCGVNWYADHVSLDCAECGGYAMQRPCPVCDGQCESIWRRDLSVSHQNHKAHWEGECKLHSLQLLNTVLHVDNKVKLPL